MSRSAVNEAVRAAATAVAKADALLIAGGAGLGVDSGLPTFRGRGSEAFARIWPALGQHDSRYEDLMSPATFDADPYRAWGFHGSCLKMYRSTVPHAGFAALLRMAARRPRGLFVYTSNVDGQFQRAGFDEAGVMECHGSALRLQCTAPCGSHTWPVHPAAVRMDLDTGLALDPLPRCPACGAVARPNVRMFSDAQWVGRETALQSARFEAWKARMAKAGAKVAIIECGAGTTIPAVRLAGELILLQLCATLIRINPDEPDAPAGHISVSMSAEPALTAIAAAAGGK